MSRIINLEHRTKMPSRHHRPAMHGDAGGAVLQDVLAVISWRQTFATSCAGSSGAAAISRLITRLRGRACRPRITFCGDDVSRQLHPPSHQGEDVIIQLIDGLAQVAEFIGHRGRNSQK